MQHMREEGPPPLGPAPPITLQYPPTKIALESDWFSMNETFLDLGEIER